MAGDISAGPAWSEFSLTLDSGRRGEGLGPLFYWENKESQHQFAVPPLFSWTADPELESQEFDFLYPLLTWDRYGGEYRFQVLQVFAFAGGRTQEAVQKRRFTLFPIYFQQWSADPALNYWALFPIYGHLQNRVFRDSASFILFPAYLQSHKKDVVTDNYLYPFFHLRHGDTVRGWQFWPVIGHEHKEPSTKTNLADEVEIVGGHDKWFGPWPIFFKEEHNLGTTNVEHQLTILPFYNSIRSPARDLTSYGWPLGYTVIDDREHKYHEVGAPWPLIDFARGEGKTINRVWPFFSEAHSATQESDFYLWPVYKFNRYHSDPLDRSRTRIMLFLYSNISEKDTERKIEARRVDFWPFFTARRDLEGNRRLQVLSILEPILPNSKSIERNYSQLWALWRSERNSKTGARSQSLLWNLYRHEQGPGRKKTSFFFGLFQSETTPAGKKVRLFHVPVAKSGPTAQVQTN